MVAKHLNDAHARSEQALNAQHQRSRTQSYATGDRVWILRPCKEKNHSRWIGPCRVLRRVGADSYVVETDTGREQPVHVSQTKPHVTDTHSALKFADFHFQLTEHDDHDSDTSDDIQELHPEAADEPDDPRLDPDYDPEA